MPSLASQVEAVLYLKGQALSAAEIARYLGCDRPGVEEALMALMEDYAHRDSALEVVETSEGYALQLRSDLQPLLEALVPLDMGVGVLRTLAAIALRGPILQTQLIDLRGSGAYQHVQELVKLGYVRKRRQQEVRSPLLLVTDKFHQDFQISHLPPLPPDLPEPVILEP